MVGLSVGLDVLEKRPEFEPRTLQPVTQSLYTLRYPVYRKLTVNTIN